MCILLMFQYLVLRNAEDARLYDRASIVIDRAPNPKYGRRKGFENCVEVMLV